MCGIQKVSFPPDQHRISSRDYPVVFARNADEFGEFLRLLVSLGWIENPGEGNYRLTLNGWRKVEEIRRVRPDSRKAFVAMWFSDVTRAAWKDGLEPGLLAAGFKPERIDMVEHNEKIDDKILAAIRQSSLVVADFSGNRAGVYFEAGFALGLGIPVIWTVHKDSLNDLHFDTRQYNHIVWDSPSDLHNKVRDRVLATVPLPRS